ncbi:MAG: HAMP domain-containing sensor histidine kinase [Acidimicrobiales bacterium]
MSLGERLRRVVSPKDGERRRPFARLGLRARITASFAFGALVLAILISTITYIKTSSSIVGGDEHSFEAQAIANATAARGIVFAGNESAELTNALTLVDDLKSTTSFALVYLGDRQLWFSSSPASFTYEQLPLSLRDDTIAGLSSEQTFTFNGAPMYGVGIALYPGAARFFEVYNLSSASDNLHALLATLIVAGIVTTALGATLGRWAAGRALRPLRDVSQAALAIAGGMLDTRLETADARDLAVLTSSFNRMADRLQQRIERDARFTSDVSHELRSPLTTLAAALSVIEARKDEMPERSQHALDLLAAEVRRFQRMVGDLLEISRYDSRSADFEPAPVEIGELVRRAAAPSSHSAVPITVDPESDHQLVFVDKRRIERVLSNLIENADRYAGGVTEVSVESEDGFVRVLVDDAGPGVPEAERTRIFERFTRGSSVAGSRGAGVGTGLGLALVREHVRLHGGRVFVTDAPSGGARFVVEIPIAPLTAVEYDVVSMNGSEQ